MNVHPLLVHFPIAFFITYSVFELIPLKLVKKQAYWFYIKAILVICGVLGAIVAGIAGKLAEASYPGLKQLINVHSSINELASAVFVLIAFAYIVSWLKKSNFGFSKLGGLSKPILAYKNIVLETPLIYLLARFDFNLNWRGIGRSNCLWSGF
jgi:uncharacterized membrane protein